MLYRPTSRALLRGMFLAIAVLSVAFPEFVVHTVLRADNWAHVINRHHHDLTLPFLKAAHFYLVPVALLLASAAWGLKRDRAWARWTACGGSVLLLLGFPAFTLLGAISLYVLFAKPAPQRPRPAVSAASKPKPETQEPNSTIPEPFLVGLCMFCAFQAFALLCLWAQRSGLPPWNPGWKGWLYLGVCMLAYTALHEFGHAAMAWTLFFRVSAIAIGPMRFWHDGRAWRFRFNGKALWDNTGYVRAVPGSDDSLLMKYIAITAAGPALSLISGLLLLLAFFTMPGSGWERWWWLVAGNAVLGIFDGVVNLLPAGNSDGRMLYHLLKGTSEGEQLLDSAKISMLWEQAASSHAKAEFEEEAELRRAVLQLAAESDEPPRAAMARSHQALGYALLAAEDWVAAEGELRQALDLAAGCRNCSRIEAHAWAGLQKVWFERGNAAEAEKAGIAALSPTVWRNRERTEPVSAILAAQVRLRAGDFVSALATASQAAGMLANGLALHRGAAWSVQAQAQMATGAVGPGLEAARQAAAILLSSEIPPSDRNRAAAELGELGEALWKWGETAAAIEMLRSAVDTLEAGGARIAGARCRVKLAGIQRSLGRETEAVYTLPDEESLPAALRRTLLAERGEVHLASGNITAAIVEFEHLCASWREEAAAPDIEFAVADGLLARALLEAGKTARSAVLARRAAAVLTSLDHPDAPVCRITLALACRERSRAVFDAALRSIETAPLAPRGEKQRRLESERARIERLAPVEGTVAVDSDIPSLAVACPVVS